MIIIFTFLSLLLVFFFSNEIILLNEEIVLTIGFLNLIFLISRQFSKNIDYLIKNDISLIELKFNSEQKKKLSFNSYLIDLLYPLSNKLYINFFFFKKYVKNELNLADVKNESNDLENILFSQKNFRLIFLDYCKFIFNSSSFSHNDLVELNNLLYKYLNKKILVDNFVVFFLNFYFYLVAKKINNKKLVSEKLLCSHNQKLISDF